MIMYFQAWFIYFDLTTNWPLLALQSNNKYVFSDRSDAPIVDGHIWWLLNGVRSKLGHLQSWSLLTCWRFDMCRLIKDLQSLRYIRMCFVSGLKHLVIQQMFTDRTRARTGRGPFDVQDSEDVDASWSTGRKSVYFVDDENIYRPKLEKVICQLVAI